MKFEEKYSTKIEANKEQITSDAFAIGELLERLINVIEKLRIKIGK